MLNQFSRTSLLLGDDAMEKLASARIAVFGIGGVGSYTAEALARSGVGTIDLIDDDKVCITNINRQLIATHSTVGKMKIEVMKERILDINPKTNVILHHCFFDSQTADHFDFSDYTYVIDAIDTVTSKLVLIECCREVNTPVISCMGAGNKLDPTRFEVDDIYNTSICPLARVMRRELRRRGIDHLKVVYSKETAAEPLEDVKNSCKYHCVCPPGTTRKCTIRRQVPGSISFVPSVAGLILAGEVINDIAKSEK